jgi:hypothetical protein
MRCGLVRWRRRKDVPAKKVLDGKRPWVTKDDPFGGEKGR